MELFTIALFCAILLASLLLKFSILWALLAGLVIFLSLAAVKGFSPKEMFRMTVKGILTVKNILITFLLIGAMTALWRAAGTIPAIVCYSAVLIRPSVFLLMTFLLNSLVSVLIGTSFGTAATIGVICATIGKTMGVNPMLTGGAVLSGAFFGDRCSPVSTSMLLTSTLTEVDPFRNIRNMIRTTPVPLALSCLIYLFLGRGTEAAGTSADMQALFSREFVIHPLCLLPAVVIFVLAVCWVPVKRAMGASILTAIPLCLLLQKLPAADIVRFALAGFAAKDAALKPLVNGGGILSMLRSGAIVCISSSYAGIFEATGLLNGLKSGLKKTADRSSVFAAVLLTGSLTAMVACNQTLSTILTYQLCGDLEPDREKMALHLEDSVIVVAALVPWSIAAAVPLAAADAPSTGVFAACFLYLLPLWRLITSLLPGRASSAPSSRSGKTRG